MMVLPAIILFFRTWIASSIPIVMVLIFTRLIRAEEIYLEGQFGDEYLTYKSAVNSLIPRLKSFKLN